MDTAYLQANRQCNHHCHVEHHFQDAPKANLLIELPELKTWAQYSFLSRMHIDSIVIL